MQNQVQNGLAGPPLQVFKKTEERRHGCHTCRSWRRTRTTADIAWKTVTASYSVPDHGVGNKHT